MSGRRDRASNGAWNPRISCLEETRIALSPVCGASSAAGRLAAQRVRFARRVGSSESRRP